MVDAFRVVVKTFKDIWGEMFNLVLMNVFTMLCIAVVIPGPPAVMALYAVCNRIANDYAISWEHYFAAFREHFRKGWLYAIAALVITALIFFNFWWYGATFGDAVWVQWVQGAWLAAAFFWLVINFYVHAFYMEQQDRRWRIALRNSALVAGANPLFTLTLLAVAGALMIVALAITPLFILLGLTTWAMLGSEAVVNRVNLYRKRLEAQAAAQNEVQSPKREV
ncbi:MAG: DUF624 domain-containing protein [Thermoflexales bacterium]|nr:DUF624 domain-containing protein [Thermoflexales bacterium]MDW8352199.1 DUF624 domain-containing protein [Anaerolineae bacterium]